MPSRPSPRIWLDRRRRHRLNTDPAPPPEGWEVAPPDFVGIGADKAGTSWWYELIVDHPGVVRPPNVHKETRYFNRFGQEPFADTDVERYHQLFPRPAGRSTGEWSPSYLSDYWVAPLLHRAAPATRLLVLLREPVERFASALAQMQSRGRSPGLTERRLAFARGCYASHLDRFMGWFPREQLLVLQYEQCAADPMVALGETYRFLGLDPHHVPDDLHRRVHQTERPKDAVADDDRSHLRRAYEGEVQRLGRLLPELDLTLWEPSATRP